MKKIFLLSLILTFNIFAQETEDKYMMLKPLSWDELQLYQLDSLLSVEELNLSTSCPATLRKLQATHELIGQHLQHILGTNYIWSEYTDQKGLKCFVKHDKVDSITLIVNKVFNPNHFELLDVTQARILKSASKSIGFKEKGIFEQARQANQHNQKLQNKPYEKYGGIGNLSDYMVNNEPAYELDEKYKKNRNIDENGSVTKELMPLYKLFELTYSINQQNKLVEEIKRKKKGFK